jgi:carbohydrate binding protein with CBM6 domain/putative Ig domain-containing protein
MSTTLSGHRRRSRAGRSDTPPAMPGAEPGSRPRRRTGPRAAAAVLALATTTGLTLAIPLAGTASAAETGTSSQTFGYTGSAQDFTVPANATSLQVVVTGAAGGPAYGPNDTGDSSGGAGATVTADLPVGQGIEPGEQLVVLVGGIGHTGAGYPGDGGYPGGGTGGTGQQSTTWGNGGGGGGYSAITGSNGTLSEALVVAAGGGGGGSPSWGGWGGNGGNAGAAGGQSGTGAGAGGAGTATAGGTGAGAGTAGTAGQGGNGGGSSTDYFGGGAGGGGYFGGGGGSGSGGCLCYSAGGGGGGSSYTNPSAQSVSEATATASAGVTITWTYTAAPLAVSTSSLPAATVGGSYSQDLSASGGISPYSWSLTSGSLPAGLSLVSDGTISGTPTAVGSSTFTVQATDSGTPAVTATQQLTLTVDPAALAVSTSSLPDGTAGSAYSQDLSASGGTSPYSWSVTSGSLPAGLSLASDGTISGTPASAGASSFTVQATDSGSPAQTATQQLTLTVGPAAGGGTSCQTTATSFISADCYASSQGTIDVTAATGDTKPSGVDGNQVAQLANGDYLEYNNVNFGSGSTQFDAQVASGAGAGISGLVEVVLDNPDNTPVGSFAVASTGGWNSWRMIPANISTVTGVHNVYLVFWSGATGNPPYVSLHYFDFPVR